MQKIYKTVYRLTVFSAEPLLDWQNLADVAESIDTGENIGEAAVIARSEITDPAVLRRELQAIGNDGEFFIINSDGETFDSETAE